MLSYLEKLTLHCMVYNDRKVTVISISINVSLQDSYLSYKTKDRCENEIPQRRDATACISLTSGSHCKPQGHFISSMQATLLAQQLQQAMQINQNNHISVQVETTACLLTEKKKKRGPMHVGHSTAHPPFLAAKSVAANKSSPFSYIP